MVEDRSGDTAYLSNQDWPEMDTHTRTVQNTRRRTTALITKMRSLAADFDLVLSEEKGLPPSVEMLLADIGTDLDWLANDLEDWTKGKEE